MNIVSIGAGYVGAPTMVVMAKHCPEHRFAVVDTDAVKIAAWNGSKLPIYEPFLDPLVREVRGKNLVFTTAVEAAVAEADIIFISVGTPTKSEGEGAGSACDLRYVEQVARTIRDNVTKDCIVVEKTTVPVGTVDMLNRIFEDCPHHIDVLSNPEFLAEGNAVADLSHPDRVIIGGPSHIYSPASTLRGLYRHWVSAERIILTNTYSAELSKLAANAMLAQRVSSINSLAEVCEHTGARIDEVAKAIGADTRIGNKFLTASLGFGGSCFKKDILSLVYIAESLGLVEVADYWNEVIEMNQHQQERMVRRMLKEMFGTLTRKRIAVFGLAFKANTGDSRNSPSLRLCRLLREEGAELRTTDPKAMPSSVYEISSGTIHYHDSPSQAAEGAHAIVLATDWPEYLYLDWQGIYDKMQRPAHIFDGRNFLDRVSLERIGFNVQRIGE